MKHPIVMEAQAEAGRAFECKKEVEKLIGKVEFDTLSVAQLLHEIKTQNYYEKFGLNSFKEYASTLPFATSKIQYLTRIVYVMEEVGLVREEYSELGISKLREITSLNPNSIYINPKTGEQKQMSECIIGLVELAKNMDYQAVKDAVRELKGLVGDDELVFVSFSVKKDVKEKVIDKAIECAKMNIGSVGYDEHGQAIDPSTGSCFEAICANFLADPNFGG